MINKSKLFEEIYFIEEKVEHKILAEDFIEGWKSHGTVQRQSKEKFDRINDEIREIVERREQKYIKVPYTTRIWMAQLI